MTRVLLQLRVSVFITAAPYDHISLMTQETTSTVIVGKLGGLASTTMHLIVLPKLTLNFWRLV